MKKMHFLLGAGASAFAQAAGSPPLGDNLFEALAREYEGWGSLPASAKARFEEAEGGFERAMAFIHANHDHLTKQLLCEMALFFLRFKAVDDCVYHRLVDFAATAQGLRSSFATLNYDTLLEQCFASRSIDCAPLKLHGCPTFTPDLGNTTYKGLTFAGCKTHVSAPVRQMRLDEAENHWQVQLASNGLAPAMALYAPEKPVLYCPKQIMEIQSYWQREISEADRVFIVGVRCTEADEHIWRPIAEVETGVAFINPSDEDQAVFIDWSRRNRPKGVTEIGRMTFADLLSALEKNRIGDALTRVM